MSSIASRFSSASIAALLSLVASIAAGQCALTASEQFANPTFQNPTHAMVVFDDGTGPALYIGGDSMFVGARALGGLVRLRQSHFETVGPDVVSPGVRALLPYNDLTGPGLVVAGSSLVGTGGFNHIGKWNGTSWSGFGSGLNGAVHALAAFDDGSGPALFAGGTFTAAGGVPCQGLAKWNGTSWSAVITSLVNLPPFNGLVAPEIHALRTVDLGQGPRLCIAGTFGSINGVTANCIALWDGTTFTTLGSGVTAGNSTTPDVTEIGTLPSPSGTQLVIAGSFSALGNVVINNFARWNGSTWSAVGTYTGGASELVPMTLNNTPVLAIGTSGGLFYYDGSTVTSTPSIGHGIEAMALFDDGSGPALFAVGNTFFQSPTGSSLGTWYGVLQKFDGQHWTSPVGQGLLGGSTTALAVHDDGSGRKLYAAGDFAYAGGTLVAHIARFNGTTWEAVGTGIIPSVRALTVYDDGTGPALLAASMPEFVNNAFVANVRKWNGTSWSIFAAGMNGNAVIQAMGVFDLGSGPALYATGSFTTAGGIALNGIARWTGSAWAPLGSGLTCVPTGGGCGIGYCMTTFHDAQGTALYVGGHFALAGGVPARNLARWNGTSWSSVGDVSGSFGYVRSMLAYDDGSGPALYIGGPFTQAGPVQATGVARWDGSVWSPVGAGLTGSTNGSANLGVAAMSAFNNGTRTTLVAAGGFSDSGGVPVTRIARWDGASWSPFGSGLETPTFNGANQAAGTALLAADLGSGSTLFVGGAMQFAAGTGSMNIAAFGPARPQLAFTATGTPTSQATVLDSALVPGHEYLNIFSLDLCPGAVGTGPYFGLCANDPLSLVSQALLPVGTEPFHILASSNAASLGPYAVPSGLSFEAICVELVNGQLGCVSTAVRTTVP